MTARVVLASAALLAATPSVSQAGPCPMTQQTNIVFYGQTPLDNGGVSEVTTRPWATRFFDWWKLQDPSIDYAILDAADVKVDCRFADYPNLEIYFQPGGNVWRQQIALGAEGKANILDFIDNRGGAYVGACAGMFYWSNDYYWQYYATGDSSSGHWDYPGLLKRLPTMEGSILEIQDYNVGTGAKLTPLSNGLNAIYFGGPTWGWRDTPLHNPGEVVATFAAPAVAAKTLPAIVTFGKVLLYSPHLEAYEGVSVYAAGLTTADRVKNYAYLAGLINKVAGTSFRYPGAAAADAGSADVAPSPDAGPTVDAAGDMTTDAPPVPGGNVDASADASPGASTGGACGCHATGGSPLLGVAWIVALGSLCLARRRR